MPSHKDPEARREYHRNYMRNWYKKNKKKHIATTKVTKQRRKKAMRSWITNELKRDLECEICGENHPATIDFHHKDPEMKEFNLGDAVRRGISKRRILEEVEKCHIWCSNCHRKHHWGENQP